MALYNNNVAVTSMESLGRPLQSEENPTPEEVAVVIFDCECPGGYGTFKFGGTMDEQIVADAVGAFDAGAHTFDNARSYHRIAIKPELIPADATC